MRILTFDIEDWFHFLEHSSTRTEDQWKRFESRVERNTHHILEFLSEHNQKATFFVIGWIADQYPSLVKKIAAEGHDIGLHSYAHQLVWQQSREEFRQDVLRNIGILEDQLGQKVDSYRAPGFSIKKHNTYAFDVLAEAGISTDASIFPAQRAHGGMPSFPYNQACLISRNGILIKEFPVNYNRFAGIRYVYSGGGYFRLWPYPIIKNATERSNYVMSYFHPRDFDTAQPLLNDLNIFRRFRAYYGLNTCEDKLKTWIQDFEFISLSKANAQLDWTKVPVAQM